MFSRTLRSALLLAATVGLGLGLAASLNGAAVTTNSFGAFVTYSQGLLASQMTLAIAMGAVMICLFMAFMGGQVRGGFIAIAVILVVALLVPDLVISASTSLPSAEMLKIIGK